MRENVRIIVIKRRRSFVVGSFSHRDTSAWNFGRERERHIPYNTDQRNRREKTKKYPRQVN